MPLEPNDDPNGIDPDELRRRFDAVEKRLSKDPSVWLEQHKMTQTEVGLRLCAGLMSTGVAAGPVFNTLAGYELTRRESPQFPARRFLTERLLAQTPVADVAHRRPQPTSRTDPRLCIAAPRAQPQIRQP